MDPCLTLLLKQQTPEVLILRKVIFLSDLGEHHLIGLFWVISVGQAIGQEIEDQGEGILIQGPRLDIFPDLLGDELLKELLVFASVQPRHLHLLRHDNPPQKAQTLKVLKAGLGLQSGVDQHSHHCQELLGVFLWVFVGVEVVADSGFQDHVVVLGRDHQQH